jgi:hypothetical protein
MAMPRFRTKYQKSGKVSVNGAQTGEAAAEMVPSAAYESSHATDRMAMRALDATSTGSIGANVRRP